MAPTPNQNTPRRSDEEEKAAAAAVARGNGSAAAAASGPGAVSGPTPAAAASNNPSDALTQLDQRIAEKNRASHAHTSSSSVSGNSSRDTGSAAFAAASQADRDVMAKRMGRPTTTAASTPGAFAESRRNNDVVQQPGVQQGLQSLEDAIKMKTHNNNNSASSRPGAVAQGSTDAKIAKIRSGKVQPVVQHGLQSLEDTIKAKMQGNNGHGAQATGSVNNSDRNVPLSRPGAFSERSNADSKVAAKVRSSNSNSGSSDAASTQPGVQQGLQSLEDTVKAKVQSNGASASRSAASLSRPGAFTETTDSKIVAKSLGVGGVAHGVVEQGLQSLEDAVQAKMKGNGIAAAASHASALSSSRPGAFSGSTEAKILAKIQTDNVKPGAEQRLKNLEDDVHSKMRGHTAGSSASGTATSDSAIKQAARGVRTEETRPGAFLASTASVDGAKMTTGDLGSVESDVLAKQRGRIVAVTDQLDAKIASKMRGEESANSNTSNMPNHHADNRVASRPGSVFESVDSKIAAKVRGGPLPTAQDELRDLEGAIRSKVQGTLGESSLLDPEHAVLQSLESKIAAKVDSSNTRPMVRSLEQGLQNLEDNIQAKVNGSSSLRVANAGARDNSHQQLRNTEDAVEAKMSKIADPRQRSEKKFPDDATRPDFQPELSENMSLYSLDNVASPTPAARASNVQSINGLCPMVDKEEIECELPRGSTSREKTDPLNDVEFGEYGGPEEDGLAVAFAVDEDGDMFIPSAVEYDPDAKPPIHRNRRFRLYACLLLVAVAIGTAGAVVGLLLSSGDSLPPALPDRSTLGIREYVEPMVGVEAMSDVTNPYRKALDWIQFVDPMALTPDSSKFLQRFLVVYLYFSTSVDMDWANGCEPSEAESVDCIYRFRGAVNIEEQNQVEAKRWLSAEDECLWGGVYCDRSGQVDKLDFSGSNMTAPSIPEGIERFPQLQSLALNYGEIRGTLPAFIGEMKHLHVVELVGNALQGAIPETWYHSRSFQKVNIGRNLLTGTISEAVRQWKDLRGFMVNNNMISGSIPEGLPIGINWLHLDSNSLSGSIPSGLGRLSQMTQLVLFRNKLQSTLPPQLGSLVNLIELRMQGNELTGSFPDEWSKLRLLWTLELSNNKLTGDILPKLVNMTELEVLRIDSNQFTGTFPRELSALKNMVHMVASGNAFSGVVGPRICNMMNPKMLQGSNKKLIELTLDCTAPSSGVAEISCPCCSHCCDPDGTKCLATGFEG